MGEMMWWERFRKRVADLFPETNSIARVVFAAPPIVALDDASFEWRVKRRADGFTMISLLVTPSQPSAETPQRYSVDFHPEVAGEIVAGLDACLAEYQRLRTEPKY